MFTKWLIHALQRRVKKMSADERNEVRKLSESIKTDELVSDTKHTRRKSKKQERRKNMADEKTAKTPEVKDEAKVEEKAETTEKVEEAKTAEGADKAQETAKETETQTDTDTQEQTTDPQVEETEPQGNGIDVNDLVTKDMLTQALASMEAKFNAVVKENSDLKEQLSKAVDDAKGLRAKYEDSDFGNNSSKGVSARDTRSYENFEDYSRQFM